MATSYIIRELDCVTDFENGFRETLGSLSPTDASAQSIRYSYRISRDQNTHKTYVADLDGQVVGTVSLLLEHKLSRDCRPVAHVEDVAVHPSFSGQGIGLALVKYAVEQAKTFKCRKVILDCKQDLVDFYAKAGFFVAGVAMRMDL